MSYVIRDEQREIDGATLVKLIQRARDRDEKRKGLLAGQCVEGGNVKPNLIQRLNRWVMKWSG